MEENFIIYVSDIRTYGGGCVTGYKTLAKLYGIDFKSVILNGISSSELLKTNDALLINFVNRVKEGKNGR